MIRQTRVGGICLMLALRVFAADGGATFTSTIGPLLKANCGECHSAKAKTSGFSIDTMESVVAGGNKHGRAVVGGHPEQSPLVRLIAGELQPRMPMGKTLAEADVARISEWVRTLPAAKVEQTAGRWWSFVKPVKTAPPAVQSDKFIRNAIDSFVLAKLEQAGVKPAPEASRRVLARRVYFDLVGMPPDVDEMAAFLNDESPNAYEKLIDKLLADTRYGERWGRHWLDLARYGETSGLEGDGPLGNVWRYRDWVIDAFNANMPYDRFITLQLAGGDEHSKTRNNYQPDVQGLIPTAFLRVAPWDRSNLVAAEVRQNYLSEVTTATSSVLLGLTVGCARCHDHKYDPIPQRDFYRLQAFFQAVQAGPGVNVPFRDEALAERAKKEVAHYETLLNDGPEKKELDAYEQELLTKLIEGRKLKSRGKPYAKLDLRMEMNIKPQRIFAGDEIRQYSTLLEDANRTGDSEEQAKLEVVENPLLEKLRVAYAKPEIDPEKRFETLTLVQVRNEAAEKYSGKSILTEAEKNKHAELSGKLDILRRRLERWRPNVVAATNVAGPPSGPAIAATRVLARGDYKQPGEAVEPGFPSAITGNSDNAVLDTDRYRQYPTRGYRTTLARWIASPNNPLTARVMVNRIWQQHFGYGLVRTPSDFGKNGEKPTHPELLDWLAVDFVESGWDIKAMHRKMLLSSTYRQAAENPTLKDPSQDQDNRLLSHYNRRRLEAEAIRDGILFVSGRLNREMGGPSVFPALPADLADFARYGRTGGLMWEPNEKDEDARRRSIYIFQRRSLPLPMMAAFDAIVFSESCERRSSTTTPLQALSMMNGDLVQDEAVFLAKRVRDEAGEKRTDQIRRLFEIVLSRPATPAELDQFDSAGVPLESISRVLLSSNEFVYVE
ncbi:MAG: PSD1 and planctomycete cytochrome C domain-containing protein [Acidobacteriota bacterium]